jgi:hypothetical protein
MIQLVADVVSCGLFRTGCERKEIMENYEIAQEKHKEIHASRANGSLFTVEFKGLTLVLDTNADIGPGNTYYTPGRNTGPCLLTCHNLGSSCIFPKESAYAFDIWECYKVISIDGLEV